MRHIIKDEAHYKLFMQAKRIELRKKLISEWGDGRVTELRQLAVRGQMVKVRDHWGPTARLLMLDNTHGLQEHYLVWQTPVGADMVVNWAFVG